MADTGNFILPDGRSTSSQSSSPGNQCLEVPGRQRITPRSASLSRLDSFPTVFHLPDNDDDGESAAGGRLAHLLQILVRKSTSVRPSHVTITQRTLRTCWSLSPDTSVEHCLERIDLRILTKQHGMLSNLVGLFKERGPE